MKSVLAIAIVMLTLGVTAAAQTTCKRHAEPAGGFSFCPPEGWTAVQDAGDKFKYFLRPDSGGSRANLNVKDEAFGGSLPEYAVAGLKYIMGSPEKTGTNNIRMLKISDFVATSNMRGLKMIFQADYKGSQIRIIQYLFDGKPGMKLVITATAVDAENDATFALFDSTVKTLRLD